MKRRLKFCLTAILALGVLCIATESVPTIFDLVRALNPQPSQYRMSIFDLVRMLNPTGRAVLAQARKQVVPYQELYEQAGQQYGIDWRLLAAQGCIESNFNANAVSRAGAKGIAQFMDTTWAEWGQGSPFEPSDAIPAQAKYMVYLRDFMGERRREPTLHWAIVAYLLGPTGALRLNNLQADSVAYGYLQSILRLAETYK